MTPLSMRYCSANSPETSALASSMALPVSCSSCRAVVGVAAAEDLVDHADRRQRAELGVAQPGIDRQMVLDVLQLRREALQLLRLGVIAHGDEGLESRLVAEPLILVGLVGSDGRLD